MLNINMINIIFLKYWIDFFRILWGIEVLKGEGWHMGGCEGGGGQSGGFGFYPVTDTNNNFKKTDQLTKKWFG